MKKIICATIFAVCLCDVNGMDSINQDTMTSSGYTLSAIRGTDSTFTVSFNNLDGNLFTKDIDTMDLIPGVSVKVDDEHLKGVEIVKKADGEFTFKITQEFILPDQATGLILNFNDSELLITKTLHANFISIESKSTCFFGGSIDAKTFVDRSEYSFFSNAAIDCKGYFEVPLLQLLQNE